MKTAMKERLRGQPVFIGLEDSKRTWKVCVRASGMIVHEISMPAEYDNLKGYIVNTYPDCSVSVMYEAGFRGFSLYDELKADGYECVVIPPHLVTEAKNNRVKTDKRDAKRLALVLEKHDYNFGCFVPDQELRGDRQLDRTVDQLTRKIISVKNQIRRAFDFHDLKECNGTGTWYLKEYWEAETKMAALSISPSLKFSLQLLFEDLHLFVKQKKEALKHLLLLGKSEQYRESFTLLKSIPGIGALTAIRLVLEWGDITRFTSAKAFASFTGMTPSEYSTGNSNHKGHITGQGNHLVRKTLVECSWRAIAVDPVLKKKFLDIVHRTQDRKIAIIAVARKLAVRARAVLLRHEPYVLGVVQ